MRRYPLIVPTYISIDIGGTYTRIARFSAPAVTDFELLARFPTEKHYERQLLRIYETLGQESIVGIGISIGAQLARDGRSVRAAPNLLDYEGKPFAQDLASHYNCLVRMAHDPVCGVIAEYYLGALRSQDRCAYVTLSTGTGGAVFLKNGGTTSIVSVQLGHQILYHHQTHCVCGQFGCLETLTGGRQIAQQRGIEARDINDDRFWEEYASVVALGLVNLAQLTRVEAVALSGGIALNRERLIPLIRRSVDAQLRSTTLQIILATHGEFSPLIGAAAMLSVPEECIFH
jgi:glucokinase